MLELRDYQRRSLDALTDALDDAASAGEDGSLVVLPTGAGKSLVIAALVAETLAREPEARVAVVTHSRELIAQNHAELKRFWPEAPAGLYSAGLGRREAEAQVLVCGVQSVWNKLDAVGPRDLVVVDEAHLIPRASETRYGRLLAGLRALRPAMRVAGFTATPYRLDSGRLDEGPGRLFARIVYEANVGDLIHRGYLSPLVCKATLTALDVADVPKRGGDYVPALLEAAVNREAITEAAVAELAAYGARPPRLAGLLRRRGPRRGRARRRAAPRLHLRERVGRHAEARADAHRRAPSGPGRSAASPRSACWPRASTCPRSTSWRCCAPPRAPASTCSRSAARCAARPARRTRWCSTMPASCGCTGRSTSSRPAPPRRCRGREDEVRAKPCPDCGALIPLNASTCERCWVEPETGEPPHDAEAEDALADPVRPAAARAPPRVAPGAGLALRVRAPGAGPRGLDIVLGCDAGAVRLRLHPEESGYLRQKAVGWWRGLGGGGSRR